MQMEGWQDHLHIDLLSEHVLFPSLHLDSAWHFLVASIFTIVLCLSERALTYAISNNWSPFSWIHRSRLRKACWKSTLYWLVTFDRLLYMLIAMTFSLGLILVIVTTLSFGQFIIEYLDIPEVDTHSRRADPENVKEPLLAGSPTSYELSGPYHPHLVYPPSPHSYSCTTSSTSSSHPLTEHVYSPPPLPSTLTQVASTQIQTRPRSKSKPTNIFIHPKDSNLARADARAQQLGLGGDTDMVKNNMYPMDSDTPWEVGTGKDLARELLGRRITT